MQMRNNDATWAILVETAQEAFIILISINLSIYQLQCRIESRKSLGIKAGILNIRQRREIGSFLVWQKIRVKERSTRVEILVGRHWTQSTGLNLPRT